MSEPVDRANRTWLCSVVFLDIVGYSTHSVMLQASVKERFNTILRDAIQHVAERDRLILDTGDGAAVCFLGDPEEALLAALELRNAYSADAETRVQPPLGVRIGVNLGPVKVVKDINGRLNAIGDGINVAQRVMSFSEPNQVLVSRSFFEVVGCLSDEYNQLFRYEGVRKDKHIREHTVYALQPPGSGEASVSQTNLEADTPIPAPAVAVTPPSAVSSLTSDQAATLAGLLAEYVGPLARVLIKRQAAKGGSPAEIVDRLAEEVPEAAERAAFKRNAQRVIGQRSRID